MTIPPAPAAEAAVRTRSLVFLLLAQVAAMSTWFATTASLTAIRQGWTLTPFHEGLLTSSVQAGFVAGTLTSALLSAADRYDLRRLFATSAAIAGIANLLIALFEPTDAAIPLLRFATGFCLAGVYPVGMKIASTWAKGDLGLLIGLLVGAVTLGSAAPHLFATAGLDWRLPAIAAGASAILGAILIRWAEIGPNRGPAPPFRLANAFDAFRSAPLRLANFGYFGHMWELYAMWTWIGSFLAASFALRYGNTPPISAGVVTFLVVASGALGCLVGGWAADRIGRTAVTIGVARRQRRLRAGDRLRVRRAGLDHRRDRDRVGPHRRLGFSAVLSVGDRTQRPQPRRHDAHRADLHRLPADAADDPPDALRRGVARLDVRLHDPGDRPGVRHLGDGASARAPRERPHRRRPPLIALTSRRTSPARPARGAAAARTRPHPADRRTAARAPRSTARTAGDRRPPPRSAPPRRGGCAE